MKKAHFGLSAKKRGVQQVSSRPTALYRSCDQLPLDKFINCYVDGDLSSLIIDGECTPDQLSDQWEEILLEYVELSASAESLYSIRLQAEINLINDKVNRVQEILFMLSPAMLPLLGGRETELVDMLRYYGFKQSINFKSDYTRVLSAIETRLAPFKTRLESRINEYNDYLKSQTSDKPSRKIFDTNLIRMSRFQGYSIRAKDISVAEYVIIFKECNSANSKKEEA